MRQKQEDSLAVTGNQHFSQCNLVYEKFAETALRSSGILA